MKDFKSWVVQEGADLGYGMLGKFLWPRPSAAALVKDESQILAVDVGNYLMLPGGGLESGETFEEAAKRETEEETGYLIELEEVIAETENSVGGVEKIFSARLKQDHRVSDSTWEGDPVWVDIEKVGEKRWRHKRDVKSLAEKL